MALEYSRYNYNATDLYAPDAFRASDHDPVVVGIDLPAAGPSATELNLLGINDFHGRIDDQHHQVGRHRRAAPRRRAARTTPLFVGAGDLIGASLFDSASPRTSRRSTCSTRWASTPRPWATTSSTRAGPTCGTG